MGKTDQKKRDGKGKMTFRCYYDTLGERKVVAPKKEFVKEIADLLMVSTKTVRGYLAGTYQPNALGKAMLAKHLNIPESELFPPKEKEA